jgi:hypothetical protein
MECGPAGRGLLLVSHETLSFRFVSTESALFCSHACPVYVLRVAGGSLTESENPTLFQTAQFTEFNVSFVLTRF